MMFFNSPMGRLGAVLGLTLTISASLLGCSGKTEDSPPAPAQNMSTSTPVPTTPVVEPVPVITDATPAPAPADDAALPASAVTAPTAAVDPAPAPAPDFLKLNAEQRAANKSGELTPEVQLDFENRWKSVTADMSPQAMIEGLDFLGVQTKATAEGEYTFYFLFHTTKDLSADYHLRVQGNVHPANAQSLPQAQQERLFSQWTRMLRDEPTSTWKSGEYRVVPLKVKTALVPYNLRVSLNTRNEQGGWVANVGQAAELGWQWDYLDEAAYIAKINAASDFDSLYAVAPGTVAKSAAVNEAVAAKWNALTTGAEAKPMIEGLDFVAVSTKATGEKEYTFSFLLNSKAKLTEDYHLSVIARVDDSHKQHIKPSKPDGNYITRSILLYNNPTSQWKAGEYHVVQFKLETEIVPYNLGLVLQTRDAAKKWKANPGNRIELGWQTDGAK